MVHKQYWAAILSAILVGSFFTILPVTAQSPTEIPSPTDVSVVMKQKKKLTLVSVRNNSEVPIYSVELENPDGKIRFVKARHWDRERLDASTVMVKTDDRQIEQGKALIILLLSAGPVSSLRWSMADEFGTVLGSGILRERAPAPDTKVITASEGGRLVSADGRLELNIAAGAVSEDTKISVKAVPEEMWDDVMKAIDPTGPVYDLEPDGLELSAPANITIRMDLGDVSNSIGGGIPALVFLMMNEDGTLELANNSTTVVSLETSELLASAEITHFSKVFAHLAGFKFTFEPESVSKLVGEGWDARLIFTRTVDPGDVKQKMFLVGWASGSVESSIDGFWGVDPTLKFALNEPYYIASREQYKCSSPGNGNYGVETWYKASVQRPKETPVEPVYPPGYEAALAIGMLIFGEVERRSNIAIPLLPPPTMNETHFFIESYTKIFGYADCKAVVLTYTLDLRIIDMKTKSPIAGADIYIKDLKSGKNVYFSKSGPDGFGRMVDLTSSDYEIAVFAGADYEPAKEVIKLSEITASPQDPGQEVPQVLAYEIELTMKSNTFHVIKKFVERNPDEKGGFQPVWHLVDENGEPLKEGIPVKVLQIRTMLDDPSDVRELALLRYTQSGGVLIQYDFWDSGWVLDLAKYKWILKTWPGSGYEYEGTGDELEISEEP